MQDKKMQSVLTLLDEELGRLLDTIGDVSYLVLPSERPEIVCFCGRAKELSGYSPDEILADRWLWANMIHPDDQERVFAAFAKCKEEGTLFEIEYRVIGKDGSLRYVINAGEPIFNDKGQVTEIEGIITDVTEFKKVKNVLLGQKSFGVAELKRAGKSEAWGLTKVGQA